ncbi:MAG: hypothetical protein ABJC12_01205 [Saprospiraceae bacterium]
MKKAELISNYFATIYLTVISLLQSVALSQLVPIIIVYFEISDHPWTDIHLMPLVLMLLIIFIVWHHYAIGIFFLRWFPNIIDTIIPFAISICQFFLISFLVAKTSVADIQMHRWMIGFSGFLIFGSFAYFAAGFRQEPDLFTNIMSRENAVDHCARSKKYYSLAGCSILFQGLFAVLILFLDMNELLYVSFVFFIIHLILSEHFLLSSIKPAFLKAMDEFE